MEKEIQEIDEQIAELRQKKKALKEKGSFMSFYKAIRNETVQIKKTDKNDNDKKSMLKSACEDIITGIESYE